MLTEHISPRYVDLDSWPTAEMVAAMFEGQLAAAAAVRAALPSIGTAVDDAVPALQRGGRKYLLISIFNLLHSLHAANQQLVLNTYQGDCSLKIWKHAFSY